MISLNVDRLIRVLWAAFGIYWVVAAKLQQHSDSASNSAGVKTKISDAPPVRIVHHAMLALAVVLLFVNQAGVGILGKRFVPRNEWMAVAGLAITIAGLGLAMWARIHLAENWSARVRIRVGHELIRSGPYAHLRHPIYSGVLLGVIGTAIVVGQYRAVISVLIVVISYVIKGRREDLVLEREFGEDWREHRRHAGFLLPRL